MEKGPYKLPGGESARVHRNGQWWAQSKEGTFWCWIARSMSWLWVKDENVPRVVLTDLQVLARKGGRLATTQADQDIADDLRAAWFRCFVAILRRDQMPASASEFIAQQADMAMAEVVRRGMVPRRARPKAKP